MADLAAVYPALAALFGTRACLPVKQTHYNRALPETVPIWEAYLARYPHFCRVYWYGVKVGEHFPLTGAEDEITKKIAKSLYTRWIDAVGWDGSGWWIFGIQPDMGTGAIGDIVAYKHLFREYYKTTLPVWGAAVTDYADPNIRVAAKAAGIEKIFLVRRPGFPE